MYFSIILFWVLILKVDVFAYGNQNSSVFKYNEEGLENAEKLVLSKESISATKYKNTKIKSAASTNTIYTHLLYCHQVYSMFSCAPSFVVSAHQDQPLDSD